MAIPTETLKNERDALKEKLRKIEINHRKVEGELKIVRQDELRTKREIEAITTLIDTAQDAPSEKS